MNNFSFIVDGGLHICARAVDEKTALKRIQEQFPRATIVLKGVDLPSAERNLFSRPAPAIGKVAEAKPVERKSKFEKDVDKLGLNETEASLVAAFA